MEYGIRPAGSTTARFDEVIAVAQQLESSSGIESPVKQVDSYILTLRDERDETRGPSVYRDAIVVRGTHRG